MASVTLEHVGKTYPGGTHALVDCNLDIADGELMVVVGPSGCGKSTLLRLVAGLEELSSGVLRIGDRVVNNLRPQERNVAMVFQDYALYPHMTARGNLEFPLRMRKLTHEDRRRLIDRIAGLLDIGRLLERLPKQLSGGERQRVAMGRALVREPSVSLFDEPLSNLDAKLRSAVRAEIKDLQHRTKTTMIYVTHDQVEAMTLGDHVTVLNKGRVQQVAAPRDLYEKPVNAFVAGFIGNPPMNLLPSSIVTESAAKLVVDIAGQRIELVVDAHLAAALSQHAGPELQIGIRPEHVRIHTTTDPTTISAGLHGTVLRTESLGHEMLVYVTLSESTQDAPVLIARVDGMPDLQPGQAVTATPDVAHVHLFAADGSRIGDR